MDFSGWKAARRKPSSRWSDSGAEKVIRDRYNYEPALGDSFRVLAFESRHGAFESTSGLTLPNNLIFEIAYGSTDVTLTAAEPQFPDLVITSVSSPTVGQSGGMITVDWTVLNDGVTATPGATWYDRIILSLNDTYGDADDISLADVQHVGALEPGEEYSVSTTFQIPLGLNDDYRILVITDAVFEVDEFDKEDNNVTVSQTVLAVSPPDFGDLRISNVAAAATGVGDHRATISWRVDNTGPNPTGDGTPGSTVDRWHDRVILSPNDIFGDGDDREIALVEHVGVLNLGEGYDAVSSVNLPGSLSGDYYVFVEVNVDDAVYEFENQAANVARSATTSQFISQPYADLAVTSFDAPLTANFRGTLNLGWTVENTNNAVADAPDESWNDIVVLSSNDILGDGDDQQIASHSHSGGLAIGDEYLVELDVGIGPNQPGSYSLFIVTAEGAIFEHIYEDNNVLGPVAIEVEGPDLDVDVVLTDTTAEFGDTLEVTYRVLNDGPGAIAGSVQDRFWLSTDGTLTDATLITSHTAREESSEPLQSGQSYTEAFGLTLPADPTWQDGDYFIVVEADWNDNQWEENETNNLHAIGISLQQPPVADLRVNSVTAPTDAQPGQPMDIGWTVENVGDLDASGSWSDSLYVSPDGTSADAVLVAVVAHSDGLAVNETYHHDERIEFPNIGDGDYRFYVVTDSGNDVYERLSEVNNQRATTNQTSVTHPDLTPVELDVPTTAVSGSDITIRWEDANIGTGTASVDWIDHIHLSDDLVLDGSDQLLALIDVTSEVTSGTSKALERTVTLPLEVSGSKYVIVSSDAADQVRETDGEANNENAAPLEIDLAPYADLAVSDVVAPEQTIDDPARVTVSWKVTNLGNGAGVTGQWRDAVIASTDSTVGNDDDRVLARFTHDGFLAAGESYDRSESFLLPPAFTGRYQLFVKTDIDNDVFENGLKANNAASSPLNFDVMPIPYADLIVTEVTPPSDGLSGSSIEFGWSVTNQGIGLTNLSGWSDKAWLASDLAGNNIVRSLGSFSRSGYLAPGDSYDRQVSAWIPHGFVGTYYLVVEAGKPFEFIYGGNNRRVSTTSFEITLTPPPDLTVTNIDTPVSAQEGQQIDIQWSVQNVGSGTTVGSWTDTISMRELGNPNARTHTLGSFTYTLPLAAGLSYTRSEQVRLPKRISGDYEIFVSTNSRRSLFENGAYSNNTLTDDVTFTVSRRPRPDLQSYTETLTAKLPKGIEGEYFVYILTNERHAKGHATQPWPPEEGDNKHRLRNVDPSNAFENPYNNWGSATLDVIYREPDIQVTDVIAPTTATTGRTFDVTFTVTNVDDGRGRDTRESHWYDRIFLSTDPTFDSRDLQIAGWEWRNGLEVGDSYTHTLTARLPDSIEGQFYLIVFAETGYAKSVWAPASNIGINQRGNKAVFGAAGRVAEFQGEGNNRAVLTLDVLPAPLPDLQVSSIQIPERIFRGQAFDLSYAVENHGGDTPGSQGQWDEIVYLSRDTSLDTRADRYLGTFRRNGGLSADSSYVRNKSFTVPKDLIGPWYVLVAVDYWKRGRAGVGRVFEGSNELNNDLASSEPLIIEEPPPADLVIESISVPTSGVAGAQASIEWVVRNDSTQNLSGAWTDTFYLSADGTWDLSDTLIGRHRYVGNLDAAQTYTASFDFELPPVTPGQYRVIGRTDIFDQVREGDKEVNNTLTSPDVVNVTVEALQLGVLHSTTLSEGQSRLYELEVPANQALRVTLDSKSSAATHELFLRHGAAPSSLEFDTAQQGGLGR
ncbi:MAG: CARDB domain-containing protein [Planctomycetota bacterium]